jgi:endonuclease/exonuclease/phosphatase family metal-dependent hydrolase
MRGLAVVVALVVTGCSFQLQGIPKNRAVEATFPGRAAVAELPAHFKAATFNIHKEPGDKVARAILADRNLRDVDLLVLQEVPRAETSPGCSSACAMGRALGMYAIYAPAHHVDGKDFGVAILSKAPITSAQIIELPWNDVHFNAGRRAALAATLRHNGRPITVYAVHLENRLKASDRRKQMLPILNHAAQQATPIILAGDFNTNPFTWVSHWLPLPTASDQAHKLEALVRSYGFDTPVKDSGATHRYIGMKLDAIYTRGFATKRFATARAQDVSDHLALWATMAPPPASAPAPAAGALASTANRPVLTARRVAFPTP